MTVTVLKNTFRKPAPKIVRYRCYKNFNCEEFKRELNTNLSSVSSYEEFETVYLNILDKYAPTKTKYVRANQAPYMTKLLRKAIMTRSALKNRFYKYPTLENSYDYKKQRNYCSRLYKKERKRYYEKLDVKNVTDNKTFWKIVKPFLSEKGNTFSKITLVEGGEIIYNDQDIAQKLNEFFSNTVKHLDIPNNSYIINHPEFLRDPIEIAIHKFSAHPSVMKIKESVVIFLLFPTD